MEYPQVSSTVERVNGFLDYLKEIGRPFKVLKSYRAVDPLSGKKVGKEILKDFPEKNSIDVVFTINDGGGLNIVKALDKAGRHEIKVATVDGDPQSIKNILKNKLTVIDSAQLCAEIGRVTMETAYLFLQKKKIAKKILIPVFPVTKETIQYYPGWRGALPTSLKKPWLNNEKWNNTYQKTY